MHSTTRAVVACSFIATLCVAHCAHAQTGAPSRSTSAPDTPAMQASSLQARLVLKTDAACDAKVGDQTIEPVLLPAELRTVTVAPGDTSVECASVALREAVVKRTVTAVAGTAHEVAFDVAPLIVKAQCAGKAATFATPDRSFGAVLLQRETTGTSRST